MSKRTTTRWYIGAWVGAVLAAILAAFTGRGAGPNPSAAVTLLEFVFLLCGIVMLGVWIGALIKLGRQHAWGWLTTVLLLHLVGLGIVGMALYAISGPEDVVDIATRPAAT